jgi:hypothetical protein
VTTLNRIALLLIAGVVFCMVAPAQIPPAAQDRRQEVRQQTLRYATLISPTTTILSAFTPATALLAPPPPQTGTVSGKVVYKGEPLRGGSIYFTGEKFKTSAKIDPDGTYIARKLPVGPLKVRILSKAIAIPKKYTSFKTSGLIVRVKPGDQEINIQLE